MIYDTFMFFNELDLLEIRLHELHEVVDFFVITEATHTFQGNPKPLNFWENAERYSDFAGQIIYNIIHDLPVADCWTREWFQRDATARIIDHLDDEDIIILSDCDEIPAAKAVEQMASRIGYAEPRIGFNQKLYFFCLDLYTGGNGNFSTCVQKKNYSSAMELRRTMYHVPAIEDGGWHWSYLGGPEKFREKMNAYSHMELNVPEYTTDEAINRRIAEAKDPFDRGELIRVNVDDTYPKWLVENLDKFKHLLRPQ